MSRSKERKLNNLRKAHIWPSVVFLFLSFFLSVIMLMGVTALMIGFFTEDRYSLITDNALTISHTLDASAGVEEEALKIFTNDTEAIYVLDSDGNTIAGFGGATFDRNNTFETFIDDDTESPNDAEASEDNVHFVIKFKPNHEEDIAETEEKLKKGIDTVRNEIENATKTALEREKDMPKICADTAEGLNIIDERGNLDFKYLMTREI